jgi:1-aminocyclopropane-1-carboxylate deaminase/D-cysteine desulfhydrase-like pyridoxal-dependent ACC family enzyme
VPRLRAARERFARIPRLELGLSPTPLRPLERLRTVLGGPRLWIKRDDWTGAGFGGNKVRKLEYYFARGLEQGATAVITTGGERSNHCRITAALAAQLGLECHLVLNRSAAPAAAEPASLWLDQLYAARIHYVERREERAPAMERLAAQLAAAHLHPLVIPLGASTPLGALGFVRAAGELAGQASELGFVPDYIVHATSSGGTQAGLVAGCRLFGLDNVVVAGVSADDPAAEIAATVTGIIAGIETELEAPAGTLKAEARVDDGFIGPGYGVPSPAGEEALRLVARTEGVVLDPVYTAKAMAGLIEWVRTGRIPAGSDVIFWHTGGQMALFSATP